MKQMEHVENKRSAKACTAIDVWLEWVAAALKIDQRFAEKMRLTQL